ncbi:MAG: BppU family phage baseplate upper protein [Sarcina sp.]
MSKLDKKYTLKLDTKSTYFNPVPVFHLSDDETSDMVIRVSNNNNVIDLKDVIALMVVINPNNEMLSSFIEVQNIEEGLLYCNLPKQFKNITGTYTARLMCIFGEEKVITNTFSYKSESDEFVRLNQEVVADSKYPVLTDMISRLSNIEVSEIQRVKSEENRVIAEISREEVKTQMVSDIQKLILDTNTKIDNYKNEKDIAIQQDLNEFKGNATATINTYVSSKNIELDKYKSDKDIAINSNLTEYKTQTTQSINDYKVAKDTEIDNYKLDKNTEINQYMATKNTELDSYKTNKDIAITKHMNDSKKELDDYIVAKNAEIDNYKNSKDVLINNKVKEVDIAKNAMVSTVNAKITEVDNKKNELVTTVNNKVAEADTRITELKGFEGQLEQIVLKDVEQDTRLDSVEYVNKRQDIVMQGLLNEGGDSRLSISGEGNSIKLEHSKDGLCEVGKVIGNTMVNIVKNGAVKKTFNNEGNVTCVRYKLARQIEVNKDYTLICKLTNLNNIRLQISADDGYNVCGSMLENGIVITKLKATSINATKNGNLMFFVNGIYTDIIVEDVIILEGDYTNKPIPSHYIEGMQSSFDDKLVTQAMVDNGEEKVENLGKYKAKVSVTGKNLFDGTILVDTCISNNKLVKAQGTRTLICKVKSNHNIVISSNVDMDRSYYDIVEDEPQLGTVVNQKTASGLREKRLTTDKAGWLVLYCSSTNIIDNALIQIEEVPTTTSPATQYEPYKHFSQTLYLDEPLYMGNELCIHEDKLGCWKNRERVVLNGSELFEKRSNSYESDKYVTFGHKFTGHIESWADSTKLICDTFASKTGTESAWLGYGEGICCDKILLMFCIDRSKITTQDVAGFKQWLQANPTTVIYELATPIFVPVLENTPQWILNSFNECTVQFETNVPVLNSSFTYTGGIPSAIRMREDTDVNTDNISVTQVAVDFLLMNTMDAVVINNKTNLKGGSNMGAYFAIRIMDGFLNYKEVVTKYPQFKNDIDFILKSEGRGDLIVA